MDEYHQDIMQTEMKKHKKRTHIYNHDIIMYSIQQTHYRNVYSRLWATENALALERLDVRLEAISPCKALHHVEGLLQTSGATQELTQDA